MREEQPSHATWKTAVGTEAGDQLSKKLAGNVVREEQVSHALPKSVPDEVSINGKEVREEQPYHAL